MPKLLFIDDIVSVDVKRVSKDSHRIVLKRRDGETVSLMLSTERLKRLIHTLAKYLTQEVEGGVKKYLVKYYVPSDKPEIIHIIRYIMETLKSDGRVHISHLVTLRRRIDEYLKTIEVYE